MNWRVSLATIALLGIATPSAAAPLCTTNPFVPAILSATSTAAEPAELSFTCSGLAAGVTLVDFSYFFNTNVVAGSTPTLTTTGNLVYAGVIGGGNFVTFEDVAMFGLSGFEFTIADILVNPSLLGAGASVVSFLSASGAGTETPSISNPQNLVAFVVADVVTVPEPGTFVLLAMGFSAWRGAQLLKARSRC